MAEYKKVVNDEPIKEGTNSEQRTFDVPTFPEGEYKGQKVSETLGTNSGELSPNPNYEAQEVLWFDGNRFLKGSAIYQAWQTAKAKPEENRTPFEKWLVEDGEIEVTSQLTKKGTVEGTETIVGTPETEGIKTETELVNFIKGLLVKGKKLEDYIDSQGGVTEEELQTALATKQDKLVSGTNIKTVNSQSLLGSGNIAIGTINETLSLVFPRITLREDGEIYSASTSHEFTTNEYSKLADDGIAIMMFNGTSIVFPYVKGTTSTDGISRLVGCVVYDDSGNSMVSRIKFNLRYDSEVSKYYANIDLDENTAQAMFTGFVGEPPYVVMKFYKLG